MASLPRTSLMRWGKRKLISKNASGYSFGKSISFQTLDGGGINGGAGIYLFAAFGAVPPGVPTAPTSTTKNCSARATCQPPRFQIGRGGVGKDGRQPVRAAQLSAARGTD